MRSSKNVCDGVRQREPSGRPLHNARVALEQCRPATARTLASVMESLERRSMLAADVLDVAEVLWNGEKVDAVRDEYVFRMAQTNTATAVSTLDYACKTPAVRAEWSLVDLGSGFFKLTAPGASPTTVVSWAGRQGVTSIDVNRVAHASKTPNDPLYSDPANWAFPKINADKAWDTGTGTAKTIVAVLDSGVDYLHPDLKGNMWKNPNETPGDGIDNDKNGVVDDVYGYNALTGSNDPMDDYGHGTFIAGLVGAVGDNATGMSGVNWTVQIMAVKVMDAAGNVSVANEVRGINYVMAQKMAGQNIVALNCSFGRYSFNKTEFDALAQIAATGVTIVAAAGNDSNDNDKAPFYPANYDITGLISVGASDTSDNLAWFSNYGATTVDLTAPGVGILSTRASKASAYTSYTSSNYTLSHDAWMVNQAAFDGTSASAAIVSGAVGLLRSLKPVASSVQVKNAILNGVDKVAGLKGLVVSGGRLNLATSVDLVLATTGTGPVPTFVQGQSIRFVEGNRGYHLAEIKVQLDRPCDPGKSCSVFYTTQPGGSAFANVDYVATSGRLTFSGSETQKSFYVRIIGDRLAESAEQFAVQILAARSTGIDPATPLMQQVNPVILDDDYDTQPVQPGPTTPDLVPKVSVDIQRDAALNPLPIYEGKAATFVVSLDRTSTKAVAVKYRTNQPSVVPAGIALEGVDYVATSGTITFKPGERTKEFTVRILTDKVLNEGVETFHVVLSEPVNAEFNTATGGGSGTTINTSSAVSASILDYAVPPPAPGFQITLNYLGNVPASIRGAAEWAAARWSQVITGDLPNVVDPQTGLVIDDIIIDVQVGLLGGAATDGAGGSLANAIPEQFRTTGTFLPWKASAGFDLADAANTTLKQIALHEFGHALGFTANLFVQKNLINAAGTGFIGANALREYRSIFGVPAALNVPIDTTGGVGTAGSHWDETVFQTELMTGYATGNLPLSSVTVGAMADLGYTVNYVKSDVYSRPRAASMAAIQAGAVGLRTSALPGASLRRSAFALLGRQ